jgi:DNA-directed RNA polymerase specialized sigma24 family protein
LATSVTREAQALRSIKSSRRPKAKQAQDYGDGYGQLEGEWATYYQIASHFSRKAKAEDRGDLLHDIMLTLHQVAHSNGQKPMTQAKMYRIASHAVADYWRRQYSLTNGLNCGSCSKAQRKACKDDWLYAECPKAIKLESLSKPIIDSEGNMTELGEFIADDQATDIDEWLDTRLFEAGYPLRLVAIAQKVTQGVTLTGYDKTYLYRFRKRQQRKLPGMITFHPPNPDIYSGATVQASA